MKPLFPYFGGKRIVAERIWQSLGTVDRYVEPFFGSGAVMLGAPVKPRTELVNDKDHHIANLWRSLQVNPEEVWRWTTMPCSEVELKVRHKFLHLEWAPPDMTDMNACDPEAAGMWLWASAVSLAPGTAQLKRTEKPQGIKAFGFNRDWYDEVVARMAGVQILCGDWKRCVTPCALGMSSGSKVTGVFLDPPYGVGNGVGYEDGTNTVAREVWEWAVANGTNPLLRIVVAGYEDGREIPEGWTTHEWSSGQAFGNKKNPEQAAQRQERLWFSPHCLNPNQKPASEDQPSLFF